MATTDAELDAALALIHDACQFFGASRSTTYTVMSLVARDFEPSAPYTESTDVIEHDTTLNLSKGELQLVKEAVAFYTTIMQLHALRGDIPVGFEATVQPLQRLEKRLADGK